MKDFGICLHKVNKKRTENIPNKLRRFNQNSRQEVFSWADTKIGDIRCIQSQKFLMIQYQRIINYFERFREALSKKRK